MAEFIGDEVEVCRRGRGGPPASFEWRDRHYEVKRLRRRWRTLDFRKAWWRRRHRDRFVVETGDGEVFELYFHRGPGRRYWVLYRRIER